eukprot:c52795_g1_i1 orf=2-169(-)
MLPNWLVEEIDNFLILTSLGRLVLWLLVSCYTPNLRISIVQHVLLLLSTNSYLFYF